MLRLNEPGWVRVGRYDPPKRRALWVRASDDCVELCSGREGDDAYVRLDKSNPQWLELEGVLSRAVWAAELSEEATENETEEVRTCIS